MIARWPSPTRHPPQLRPSESSPCQAKGQAKAVASERGGGSGPPEPQAQRGSGPSEPQAQRGSSSSQPEVLDQNANMGQLWEFDKYFQHGDRKPLGAIQPMYLATKSHHMVAQLQVPDLWATKKKKTTLYKHNFHLMTQTNADRHGKKHPATYFASLSLSLRASVPMPQVWEQRRKMLPLQALSKNQIYIYTYVCGCVKQFFTYKLFFAIDVAPILHIQIYAVKLFSGPSLGFSKVIIWAKFVFTKTLLAQKHYKIGVSAHFLKKKVCTKIPKLLSGPSWPFLCCNKLGPDNNINLAQIITLENGHFFFFLLLKMY